MMVRMERSAPAVVVDAAALERVGVALADGTRRRLLLALLEGPAFPADLADRLSLTRGNVSNHLGCLRGCGLVRTEAVGRRVRYHLADPRLAHALADLVGLVLLVEHDDDAEPAQESVTGCVVDSGCCPTAIDTIPAFDSATKAGDTHA
jgi:DNA-binding transcriptional ArsR family regulator